MIPLFRVAMNMPRAADLVAEVLASGYVGEGQMVERFEQRLAALLHLSPHPDGEPPILAVNSCTMALTIALDCIGVGHGDEVITTPITCTATSGAIAKTGAKIVWADVDPGTGNIDPADVARKITPKTRAIVAVDWGGRPCDYRQLMRLSMEASPSGHRPPIIEDAAHAFLATTNPLPGWYGGDYVAFSFGPIKHLTCGGYGGALIAPLEQTKRARLLRWHGLDRRSSADFRCAQDITEAGYRGHMTDDQAAVGLANTERVLWVVEQHRANAAWYDNVLKGLPGVTLPPPDPGSSYWLYTLLSNDRDALQTRLAARGVASSQVHARNDNHTAFGGGKPAQYPLTGVGQFARRQLSIPVGWWLSEQDRERVAEAVWEAATQREVAYA